ncbi:metallophosphoesterase [Kordiimonas laminariae]|uniref:metallophosphoesterase n=1 Tax=Kordiimonas laminariae TaxID=2917717 RepID=UPI001FF664F0|nr:metallophosphoesterase [Kordiimonas laminariae]MCK0068520.1 metallophosphoesterase [Kordiimonas laminariae]
MRLILTNLKHFFITATLLLVTLITAAVAFGVDIDMGDNDLAYKLGGEGPHVFYEGDNIAAHYIKGGGKEGFYIEKEYMAPDGQLDAEVYFPLEDSTFNLTITPHVETPKAVYNDGEPIVAISDVESNFKTFRDFLIAQQVIDADLNWTFGKGHLVLVGDFVDRGDSTTQVLWFIYKLEQEAKAAGGTVHFILGNHEIKNLQGNFQKAADKYFYVAAALKKQEFDLFGDDALLGRWMASKNTIERINGYLFVHGGLHPDIVEAGYSLDELNTIVRNQYRQAYVPTQDEAAEAVLVHRRKGPSWYRGYFEADLSQETVEKGLKHFGAKAVVVGHQPQWSVGKHYDGKVFAVNVKHPKDYRGSFPSKRSEGLLLNGVDAFRLLDDGTKEQL